MDLKALARKYNDISLIKRIVAGLAVGAVLGIAFPNAEAVGLLGTLFVSALKAVAPVLVFFLVTSALANAKAAGSMRTVVVLYLVSTFAAALVAVGASYLFPTELTLAAPAEAQGTPSGIGEVLAGRILDYRTAQGGFTAPEELMNVSGIKEKTYEKLKDLVTVSAMTPSSVTSSP